MTLVPPGRGESRLHRISLAAQPVLDILAAAGMLDDDRQPPIIAWYSKQVAGLPEPMATEVRTWFDILHAGSTVPPRSYPPSPGTIRLRVASVALILQRWAAAGHTSLREITRDDVKAVLPPSGSPRSQVGTALRSLFRLLKARKLIFANPNGTHPDRPTRNPRTTAARPDRAGASSQCQ